MGDGVLDTRDAKVGFMAFIKDLNDLFSKKANEIIRFSVKVMSLVLACPFLQEESIDLYAYKLPVFILLIANSFFLVWIMVVSCKI